MHQEKLSHIVWAVVVVVAFGLSQLQYAEASDFPYTGVVAVKMVDVRSGAGDSYYIAGRLRQGTLVRVHSHFHGWYKIAPPPGVSSYVLKAFVNRQGDGAVATVTRDRVLVKTAAIEGPPGDSYRQQCFLHKDDKVRIVVEDGDYYKILPPTGAFVFLAPGSVHPATAEQIVAARSESQVRRPRPPEPTVANPAPLLAALSVKPAGVPQTVMVEGSPLEPDAAAKISEPVPAQVGSPEGPDKQGPAAKSVEGNLLEAKIRIRPQLPQVRAAEMRLAAASKLPPHEQPVDDLLASYEALSRDTTLEAIDRHLVRLRVVHLRKLSLVAATLRDLADFREQLKSPLGRTNQSSEVGRSVGYVVVGKLLSSIVYDGRSLPVMYRVVELGSLRTLAYVRPSADLHTVRCLGKLVGVVGRRRFDPALKVHVLEAVRVDRLEPVSDERTT